MRPRFTLLIILSLAAALLTGGGASPAEAHRPTLCQQVRAWSGHGCTTANTRAFWKAQKARNTPRATRNRGTAGNLPAVLRRIRGCESGSGPTSPGNYSAENGSSSASGAFQFTSGTWRSVTGLRPPASAYSRAVQDRAAIKHYRDVGTSPWNASRGCWG
jgi:hypothetical protein